MSTTRECTQRKTIDRHFAGELNSSDEHAMFEHLPSCDVCRSYCDRRLLLAELDPKALSAQDRIGQGLGLHRPSPRRIGWSPMLVAAMAAICLLVMQRTRMIDLKSSQSMVARGSGALEAGQLIVYHVDAKGKSAPVAEHISAQDRLAFAYRNIAHRARLMVFGVDESGRVYWYFPAWTQASDNPTAIPIVSDAELHELPEAIAHRLSGHTLRIHALFTDAALSVKEVEAELKSGGAGNSTVRTGPPPLSLKVDP